MAIIRKKKKPQQQQLRKISETDLAAAVVDWLKKGGWTVYQEVSSGYAGPRADIVAVKNGLSWIIETKLIYNLQVMEQAYLWRRRHSTNFVSIAVLMTKKCRKNAVIDNFHYASGIGLIEVQLRDDWYVEMSGSDMYVNTRYAPRKIRTGKSCNIKNALSDRHKDFCKAGSAGGGYLTAFKESVEEIKNYIKKHPGKTIKEVIEAVGSLHWSNPACAKACIAKYLNKGIIKGVRRRDGALYIEGSND